MKNIIFLLLIIFILFNTRCKEDSKDLASDYENRKSQFFESVMNAPPSGTYTELVRLYLGYEPDETEIQKDLDSRINSQSDTADFVLHGVLRLLYQFSESFLVSSTIKDNCKTAILNFKYWPDELELYPDSRFADGMDDVSYQTENHYLLFASGAYLAGQLYPDEIFTASNETGLERMIKFKHRIMKWLELRYRTGNSEWLSSCYYNENILGLVNIIDFCNDNEITQLATMVLDLIMLDLAINHFKGNLGTTHGRDKMTHKMSGNNNRSGSSMKLLLGQGKFSPGNSSCTCIALSNKYKLPAVIYEIANDKSSVGKINKQRMSIKFEDNVSMQTKWGLDYSNFEDGMTFLTFEAYTHPFTIELFKQMLDNYYWYDNGQFLPFKNYQPIIQNPLLIPMATGLPSWVDTLPELASVTEHDITRNMRPEVNIYTYRTSEYVLSTAQDWRKGFGGNQESIWQATMGTEAICFIVHPAIDVPDQFGSDTSPNYWTGNGTLPRAVQVENIVISVYDITTAAENATTHPALYISNQPEFTHAYLPSGKFDEAYKIEDWFFARKDDAFLALYSSDSNADWETNPYTGVTSGNMAVFSDKGNYRIKADGEKQVWICEMGHVGDGVYSNFDDFKNKIKNANIDVNPVLPGITYVSPSQGTFVVNWNEKPTLNGIEIHLDGYKRYDNEYSSSEYPGDDILFSYNGYDLVLDFKNRTRTGELME